MPAEQRVHRHMDGGRGQWDAQIRGDFAVSRSSVIGGDL
jgi:hypothetical protein